MVLHVLAVAGLLWALWRARGTFSVIDGTLRQAFGPTTSRAVAPYAPRAVAAQALAEDVVELFKTRAPMSNGSATLPYIEAAHRQQHLTCFVLRTSAVGPGWFC